MSNMTKEMPNKRYYVHKDISLFYKEYCMVCHDCLREENRWRCMKEPDNYEFDDGGKKIIPIYIIHPNQSDYKGSPQCPYNEIRLQQKREAIEKENKIILQKWYEEGLKFYDKE